MPTGVPKEALRLPAIDVLGTSASGNEESYNTSWKSPSIAHADATDLTKYKKETEKRIRHRLQGKRTLDDTLSGIDLGQGHPGLVLKSRFPEPVTHETIIPGGEDVVGSGGYFFVRNNGEHVTIADDQVASINEDQISHRDVPHDLITRRKQSKNDKKAFRRRPFVPDRDWIHKEIVRMGLDRREMNLAEEVKSRVVCGNALAKIKKNKASIAATRSQIMKVEPKPRRLLNHKLEDPDLDYDAENLSTSMTLPRIEAILRAEGIKPQSIAQQIDRIKDRCKRHQDVINKQKSKLRLSVEANNAETGNDDQESTVTAHAQGPTSLLATPRKSKLVASYSSFKSPRDSRIVNQAPRDSRVRDYLTSSSTSFQTPRDIRSIVIEKAHDDVSSFISDIEHTRWLSWQQMEKGSLPVGFVQPRIILISSKIPNATVLEERIVLQESSLLVIRYDFETASYQSLSENIRKRLDAYREDCKMKSILIYCQGGPGYLYMIKKRVVTPQKLTKKNQTELVSFWKSVGDMISKVDVHSAAIHIMGCNMATSKQGAQLVKELKKLLHPNVVEVDSINDTVADKENIALYFDYQKYLEWRGTSTTPRVTEKGKAPNDSELEIIREVQQYNLPPILDNG